VLKLDFKYEIEGDKYCASELLPSGQIIYIEFQKDWSKSKYYFNIFLEIKNKKRNNYSCLQQTGKDGLIGLLWAKDIIKEFEIFIKQEYPYKNHTTILHCGWDDNRRRNVYERGLRKMGYTYGRVFGYKALMKELKNV